MYPMLTIPMSKVLDISWKDSKLLCKLSALQLSLPKLLSGAKEKLSINRRA